MNKEDIEKKIQELDNNVNSILEEKRHLESMLSGVNSVVYTLCGKYFRYSHYKEDFHYIYIKSVSNVYIDNNYQYDRKYELECLDFIYTNKFSSNMEFESHITLGSADLELLVEISKDEYFDNMCKGLSIMGIHGEIEKDICL